MNTPKVKAGFFLFVTPAILFCQAGCRDLDWNWDAAWWKRPKRVVRPTRPRPQPSQTEPRKAEADRAKESETRDSADRTPDTAADSSSEPKLHERPFYQLYLIASSDSKPDDRGEHRIKLKHLGARTCAKLLEMLYVPLGRSGSDIESYLIYENRDEFKAAFALAPDIDVPAHSSAGPEASFQAGVAVFASILDQGVMADRGSVDACEHHLAEALQSMELQPTHRWVAGILLGRLVSEYRYDYATARSYCLQAERASTEGSFEWMTARWWIADAYTQEGNRTEADRAYQEIVDTCAKKWNRSHIVRRALEILKNDRKR